MRQGVFRAATGSLILLMFGVFIEKTTRRQRLKTSDR